MSLGKFIAIEGGEGSGKSSAIEYLKEHFWRETKKNKTIFTREPGGTPFAEEIRGLTFKGSDKETVCDKTEFLLFCAARAQHVENLIIPALNNGTHVITDRFSWSTYSYQIYGRRQYDLLCYYKKIESFSCNYLKPIVVFFDVDPETGLKRRQLDGKSNRFDTEDIAFHERVRQGYLDQFNRAEEDSSQSVYRIDANRDIKEVQKEFFTLMALMIGV